MGHIFVHLLFVLMLVVDSECQYGYRRWGGGRTSRRESKPIPWYVILLTIVACGLIVGFLIWCIWKTGVGMSGTGVSAADEWYLPPLPTPPPENSTIFNIAVPPPAYEKKASMCAGGVTTVGEGATTATDDEAITTNENSPPPPYTTD